MVIYKLKGFEWCVLEMDYMWLVNEIIIKKIIYLLCIGCFVWSLRYLIGISLIMFKVVFLFLVIFILRELYIYKEIL